MPNYPEYGTPRYFTVAGATCVTSSPAQIVGILFHGTSTGEIQIWAGVTATTNPISGAITAFTTSQSTLNSFVYCPFPAYCSGGFSVNIIGSNDPKITLFWNPVG